MKKKFLLALITICLSIFAIGVLNSSAATYGNLTYEVSNGKVTITGCDTSVTTVTIPSKINGYPVTSIGNEAFFDCQSLISITIPNSVTSIREGAFSYCESLTSITIPNSVTSIENGAFSYCESLTSISVNKNNTKYSSENGVLFNKNKTSLIVYPGGKTGSYTIPDSITSIGDFVFSDCSELTSITIPDSVTSIGYSAFCDCSSLTSITIPDSVTSIGNYAFYNTGYYNNSNNWKDSVLYINNHLIDAKTSISGSYTIKTGTKTMANNAFSGCSSLTSITIPNSVTSIGDSVFYGCSKLKTVYYIGTEENFSSITIGSYNSYFKNATVKYVCYVTIIDENGNKAKVPNEISTSLDTTGIEREGYDFTLYYDENYINPFDLSTIISSEMTLYVKYSTAQYTCKFINYDGSIIKSENIFFGTVITAPQEIPSKPSTQQYTYTFSGWSGFSEGITQKAEEMIFTAQYTETLNKYTYKFTDTDGTVLKEETVDYGTTIIPPEISGKTEYYILDYWQNYTNGMTITDNITFTAVYKYQSYNISVNGLSAPITVTYNDNFIIEPQEKENYNFIGYFTEKDGKGTKITNETGNSLSPYNVAGDLTVYPYLKSIYMNKAVISGITSAMPGDELTQNIIFATDKDIQYLVTTIKYPEHFVLKEITAKDFAENYKDSEVIKDGYKYLSMTCLYDYDGNSVPLNQAITPFELNFVIAPNAVIGEAEISIEEAILIGSSDFEIEQKEGIIITIIPKLAESIEIIGSSKIEAAEKYTAVILPDYTTNKEVTWSVSDETVATISPDGILTPVKNGIVTITATANDGSNVSDTMEVEVVMSAKLNSLNFGEGVCLEEFNPHKKEYTVFVKKDATTITLTPTFTGGVLRPNGSGIWMSGKSKEFELTNTETVITLNRENVTDMENNVYTITVIKYTEGTKTAVSPDGKTFTINPLNVEAGNTIILALYNGGKFVEAQTAVYEGETLTFTTEKAYTTAEVMAWSDLLTLSPVTTPEVINR